MTYHRDGYLPKWHIFCENNPELPNPLKWRKPSTIWENWLVISMVAETDFLDNNASSRPNEVGWRNIPPMWSVPATVYSIETIQRM